MNCSVCGTPIDDTTDICPNCGANVRAQLENTAAEDEIVEITEDMAAPELLVNQENMKAGVSDLTDGDNTSIYAPETEETLRIEQADVENANDRVDFQIPAVKQAEEVEMPTDGTARDVNPEGVLLAVEPPKTNDVTELKIGGKTLKLKSINLGKSVGMPIVIGVGVLALVIGLLIGKSLFAKNYCATPTNTSVINTKVKYVNDGKNNVTNVGNFTYKIPEDYNYDKANGGVYIYGKNDAFRIFIRADNGDFSNMSGAKKSIKESLIANGTNVNNIRELNIQSKNFIIIETTVKNANRLVAFGEAVNDYVYYIEIVDINNNYSYDVLDIASDIVQNATYQERESKMEKVEINDVSKLVVKASLEYKSIIGKN